MHFAAFIDVGESVREPAKYYHNNLVKTIVLLNAMLKANVKYFIFSSTAAVFGEPLKVPVDESHSKNPINPYGQSKLAVEKILKDYDAAYGLKSSVLRYFNAAGADDNGATGEAHPHETHLIPLVLRAAAEKKTISVFGDDYPTQDGTCERDFIHVNDLARAHILALEYLFKTRRSEDFNLGSGHGFTVKKVIETAMSITAKNIKIKYSPRRKGDPAILVADGKKAKKLLGWRVDYNLRKIIETAWNWELKRKY
jgi:UDP-glucose 4-epimerase